MASNPKSRNIVRVRTFEQDLKEAREHPSEPKKEAPKQKSDVTAKKPETPETTASAPVANEDSVQKKMQAEVSSWLVKDIKQEVETVDKASAASVFSDDETIHDTRGDASLGTGSIVRDRKRKRFRFFPAVAEAMGGWFEEKKEEHFKEDEEAVVESSVKRIDTIRAAKEHGIQAPQEDHDSVAERLKNVRGAENDVTVQDEGPIIVEKPKEEEPQWTRAVDEDVRLSGTIPIQKVDAAEPEAIVENAEMESSELEAIPEIEIEEETSQPVETSETEVQVEKEVETVPPQEKLQHPKRQPALEYAPVSDTAGVFPMRLFIIVALIAVVLGIGVSLYFFGTSPNTGQATVYRVPSLITVEHQIFVPLGTSREELLQNVLNEVLGNAGVAQIYPTETLEGGERPAAIETILSRLELLVPPTLTRSITEMTFGGRGQEPYILMSVNGFDAAFAGTLEWEQTMSSDLYPLFGEAVFESFDPHARTDTQVRSAFFRDVVVANTSARLLVDEFGDDRIVYAFVDQNTLLITTTKDAMETLLPLIK